MLLKKLIKEGDIIKPKDRAIFFTGSSVDFKRDLASIKMTEAITSNGVFPAAFLIVEQKWGRLSPNSSA